MYSFVSEFASLFSGATTYYYEQHLEELDRSNTEKQKVTARCVSRELTDNVVNAHLEGTYGLGVSPIDEESKSLFGVIDIDVYGVDFSKLVHSIYEFGLPLVPVRSKSGGLHLYLFCKKKVKAKAMKDALESLSEVLGLNSLYGTKCELFPKQERLNPGQHGNSITLPYFAGDTSDPLTYAYKDDMTPMSLGEFLTYATKNRVALSDIESGISELPYSDAPPCVQRIHLLYPMKEGSGRNNSLFTAAVYFKKKYESDFATYVRDFNNSFEDPLDDDEIVTIISSVAANEYNYRCSAEPCKTLCSKKTCSIRKYGFGTAKGYFTGLDYGKMYRIKSAKPYYLWELRPSGSEGPFIPVRFDDEAQLMDQRFFSKMCMRYLNMATNRVDEKEWTRLLNDALSSIQEQSVAFATDTSDLGRLQTAFKRFLTQRRTNVNSPIMINLGTVYNANNRLYFSTDGIERFLRVEDVKLNGENLREVLLQLGCRDSKLEYVTSAGRKTVIECWEHDYDEDLQVLEECFADIMDLDRQQIEAMMESTETEEADIGDEEIMF
jgi:hypothetical protein